MRKAVLEAQEPNRRTMTGSVASENYIVLNHIGSAFVSRVHKLMN